MKYVKHQNMVNQLPNTFAKISLMTDLKSLTRVKSNDICKNLKNG